VNPFVELARDPVTTLGALAYVLLLLGISIGLAGWAWSTVLWVRNAYANRRARDSFGPEWEYVPPLQVYGRVALLCVLAAIEAALLGGIIYVVAP